MSHAVISLNNIFVPIVDSVTREQSTTWQFKKKSDVCLTLCSINALMSLTKKVINNHCRPDWQHCFDISRGTSWGGRQSEGMSLYMSLNLHNNNRHTYLRGLRQIASTVSDGAYWHQLF